MKKEINSEQNTWTPAVGEYVVFDKGNGVYEVFPYSEPYSLCDLLPLRFLETLNENKKCITK